MSSLTVIEGVLQWTEMHGLEEDGEGIDLHCKKKLQPIKWKFEDSDIDLIFQRFQQF